MDSQNSPDLAASALAKILLKEVALIRAATEKSASIAYHLANAAIESNHIAKDLITLEIMKSPRYRDPRHLAHFEFKAFSQSGEDGIIKEILERIGVGSRQFLEVGVGPDLENNTTFLISQGWKGIWMDFLPVEQMRQASGLSRFLDSGALKYISSLITPENVRQLLFSHLPSEPLDVFSLDLDRNTYHIWEAMDFINARVLVFEYNSIYPPPIRWVVQPEPGGMDWTTTNFGASLASFYDLAQARGYELVHCGLTGVNAFFVKRELLNDRFYLPPDVLSFFEPYRSHIIYNHTLNRSL